MTTRILFVEDEKNAVSAYFPALSDYDIECFYASSGDETARARKN